MLGTRPNAFPSCVGELSVQRNEGEQSDDGLLNVHRDKCFSPVWQSELGNFTFCNVVPKQLHF